jgi:hypothetical protein
LNHAIEELKTYTTSKSIIFSAESLPVLFDLHKPFSLSVQIKKIQLTAEKILGPDERLLPINGITTLQQLYRKYALCALEGILSPTVLPYDAFRALLTTDTVDRQEDMERLNSWVQAINSKQTHLGPWIVHQALLEYAHQIFSDRSPQEVLNATFALELNLSKRGCAVLTTNEPSYEKWLQTVCQGTKIHEGQNIRLGQKISHPAFDELHLMVFERFQHTDQYVVLGKTPLTVGLWNAQCSVTHNKAGALPLQLLTGPESEFLVMEKLLYSVDQIPWNTKYGSINNIDLPLCNELARLVSWMVSQTTTSKNFLSKYIFFDQAHILKSLLPLSSQDPYDMNILIDFLLQAANECSLIFRKLMEQSQLSIHPVVRFYETIVRKCMTSSAPIVITDHAASANITDPNVISRATHMVSKLDKLVERLFHLLVSDLKKEISDKETLRTAIKHALTDFQDDFHSPATDWENRDNNVLIDYVKQKCASLLSNSELYLHNLVFNF